MRTYAEEPLLQKDGIVEGKRWFILLAFSWIEFNQVHRSALRLHRLPPMCPRR
jgi:hypothetical protein